MKICKYKKTIFVCLLFAHISYVNSKMAFNVCNCPDSKFEGGDFYSQAYEDYILAYVFSDLDSGTYVDVGANDPESLSVTKYFYKKNWKGINIEPNPLHKHSLEKNRPKDINLTLGIGAKPGSMLFYRFIDHIDGGMYNNTLSTFNREFAERLIAKGMPVKKETVKIDTLDNIFRKYDVTDVTFLSIDVEGFEKQVLDSIDFNRVKPTVIVAEYTTTNWEHDLLAKGYVYAMNDTINRYYVRDDKKELLYKFNYIDMCVKLSKLNRNVNPYTYEQKMSGTTPIKKLQFNKEYLFSDHNNWLTITSTGLSLLEKNGRWSDGDVVDLFFKTNKPRAEYLTIQLKARGVIIPQNPKVSAKMYLNDVFVGEIEFNNPDNKTFSFRINSDTLKRNNNVLRFHHIIGSIRPHDLGLSFDRRKIGLFFQSINILDGFNDV